MKRKFSFNLAPVKIAAKAEPEEKQPSEPKSSHSASSSTSHRRHGSKDSICSNSPWINRPVIDPQTELELRAACRLILRNFKPSDHGMENTDPKLDFGAMSRPREPREHKEHKTQTSEVRVRMPTGAPADAASNFVARKPSTKTRSRAKADMEIRARKQNEGPARSNSTRQRADFAWLDDRDDKRQQNLKKYGKSPSIDLQRPAAPRTDTDDEVVTPVTVASSYAYSKNASTAPTSASLTSGRSSNRRSRQLDNPAAIADAQAAEWMRQELEKKKKEDGSQARPSTAVRPPSRSASIRNNIREYVFPGTRSRSLSRAQSSESLRTAETLGSQDSQDIQRSGSVTGWRGWNLPRRTNSRSNSRPGTSKGPAEESEQSKKGDSKTVNLNRELPPLPGLDTWKDPEPEPPKEQPQSPKSPMSATHIASLMRPQEPQQERSPAPRGKDHRRSGSDTLAMQFNSAFPVRGSSRQKPELQIPLQPTRTAPDSPVTGEHVMTGWSSTSNLNSRLELGSSIHTRQRSGDTNPTSPDGKPSIEIPSFAHKMSMDALTSRSTTSKEAKITRKEEHRSRLKNIFSGWIHRKEKKDDWMHKIEKQGVKEGVIVQDGGSVAPVVRY
ncbi:hypothetical protein IQ07DRAFT_613092 [Pyrenochaeta sp. DS3sAY3a]|nr:hypothetical protein IQ07DRAFT_613092 [Pyrenochaeta sp. DS3sAY3a]